MKLQNSPLDNDHGLDLLQLFLTTQEVLSRKVPIQAAQAIMLLGL